MGFETPVKELRELREPMPEGLTPRQVRYLFDRAALRLTWAESLLAAAQEIPGLQPAVLYMCWHWGIYCRNVCDTYNSLGKFLADYRLETQLDKSFFGKVWTPWI